tara:strand:- start:1202 stop:1465 length:264 start_codon:yes stop_codon:yes gene_type:complete
MAFFFVLSWFIILFFALRLIFRGWNSVSDYNNQGVVIEGKRYVTKGTHPEMAEVKPGDELLVVNFSELKDRIDEYEEDDDGDMIVRR